MDLTYFLFKFLFCMSPNELYKEIGCELNKKPTTIKIKYRNHEHHEIWLTSSFSFCRPSTITPSGLRQFDFYVHDD